MPRIAFTDLSLSRLKPTKLYITYWDRALPSFGVRVGLHSKTFVLMRGGERKFHAADARSHQDPNFPTKYLASFWRLREMERTSTLADFRLGVEPVRQVAF